MDPIQYIGNLLVDFFRCIFDQFYIDVVFTRCLVVSHLPNCCFHFFGCYFPIESLCSSDELLDVVDAFYLLKCFIKCCSSDLLKLLWLWHTSFLIVMHKLDLLMFHVQSFSCFEHLGVIFSVFYFSYKVFCSFFSGISNFLIHLFEYIFPWFSQLFVLLWDWVFAMFNLEFYVLMFFWHPFKVWIWYLVVISFAFFLYPKWVSAAHLMLMSLSFSHLYSCCAATYSLLSISCLICSLYLSWFSSFCVSEAVLCRTSFDLCWASL